MRTSQIWGFVSGVNTLEYVAATPSPSQLELGAVSETLLESQIKRITQFGAPKRYLVHWDNDRSPNMFIGTIRSPFVD